MWRLDTIYYSKDNPAAGSEISYVTKDQLKQYPITLVLDKAKGSHIEIGRIKQNLCGEIDSLFINEAQRGGGLGRQFIENAIV